MPTFAVIGAGFGLYGYVPAIARIPGARIRLAKAYLEKFDSRRELTFCRSVIQWVASREDALAECDTAVLALPPERQMAWIDRSLKQNPQRRLLLEKPLGPTPSESQHVFEELLGSRCVFRIGYLFRYTDWFSLLKKAILQNPGTLIDVSWQFKAAHFLNSQSLSWKSDQQIGGGALSFYGIHLLACAAELGYEQVESSNIDENHVRFTCTLIGRALPKLLIKVDTNFKGESLFEICHGETAQPTKLCSLRDPLRPNAAAPAPGMPDSRISFLEKHIQNLLAPSTEPFPHWYPNVIALWNAIDSGCAGNKAAQTQGFLKSA